MCVCVSERDCGCSRESVRTPLAVCESVRGLEGTVGDFPSAPRSLTSFHTDGFCLFSKKSACDGGRGEERGGMRLRGMDNECDV